MSSDVNAPSAAVADVPAPRRPRRGVAPADVGRIAARLSVWAVIAVAPAVLAFGYLRFEAALVGDEHGFFPWGSLVEEALLLGVAPLVALGLLRARPPSHPLERSSLRAAVVALLAFPAAYAVHVVLFTAGGIG